MNIDLDRRAFVQTGVALAAGATVGSPAAAQTAGPGPAGPKPMTFDVKPMPFDPTKIKGLSEKILTSHYANNYTGAVKRLNQITEQLAALDYAHAGDPVGQRRQPLRAARPHLIDNLTRPWGVIGSRRKNRERQRWPSSKPSVTGKSSSYG